LRGKKRKRREGETFQNYFFLKTRTRVGESGYAYCSRQGEITCPCNKKKKRDVGEEIASIRGERE